MELYTAEQVQGKFIISSDCMNDEELPTLYDSEDEAYKELFDDNLMMLKGHRDSNCLGELNEGVTPEMIEEMNVILKSGDVAAMRQYMDEHPECDDLCESVEPAEGFCLNRKLIFGAEGFKAFGTPIHE